MRDTDRDWSIIAEKHPFYGVITDPALLEPTTEAIDAFYAHGEAEIAAVIERFERFFGGFHATSALDFGCGVGRLAIPMAKRAGQACGIDIAPGMLRLAAERARQNAVELELLTAIPQGRQFDWVNSIIVLQHIPPVRGYDIIRMLWEALVPGGFLSLQFPIFKETRVAGATGQEIGFHRYDGESVQIYSRPEFPSGVMSMFDYDLNRVMTIIGLNAGQQIMVEKTDHGGCHGVHLFVRKEELRAG